MMWERTTPYATPKLCSMLLRHLPVWALGAPAIAPPLLMVLSRRGPAGRPVPSAPPCYCEPPDSSTQPFLPFAVLSISSVFFLTVSVFFIFFLVSYGNFSCCFFVSSSPLFPSFFVYIQICAFAWHKFAQASGVGPSGYGKPF